MIDPQNPADRELHGLTRESHAPENLADPFQQGWRQGPYDLWYDYHSHMLAMNALRNVSACRFRVSDRVRFLDLACSNLRMTAFFCPTSPACAFWPVMSRSIIWVSTLRRRLSPKTLYGDSGPPFACRSSKRISSNSCEPAIPDST